MEVIYKRKDKIKKKIIYALNRIVPLYMLITNILNYLVHLENNFLKF